MTDVIIAANSAGFGDGPIVTYNYTTNTLLGSFVPDDATAGGDFKNGRGLALNANHFYYTELSAFGFGPTTQISIAPYNGGAGGSDTGSFPNPAPAEGISALVIRPEGLYALTGYPSDPPRVWLLDINTGAVIGGPITLAGAAADMDGFTVLPDGTFLGNLGDTSNIFTHWNAAGINTGGNFTVPGTSFVTGADLAPDGLSFYFSSKTGGGVGNGFVQTDLLGNLISSIAIVGGGDWEDIAIQQDFSGGGGGDDDGVFTPCDEFDEVRFPTEIAFDSKGGSAMRQTQIVILGSGAEQRKARWTDSRRTYDIGYGLRSMDDIHTVISFFECRNARLIGFRLKDWTDWKSCGPKQNVGPFDQLIGVGDGVTTTFQLVKLYSSGTSSWTRKIIKPVAGTVRIALGGVEQLSGWSVDTTTGIVTFVTPPSGGSPGVAVHAGYEFDTPVRFDTDKLEISLAQHKAGQAQSIPMIELPQE